MGFGYRVFQGNKYTEANLDKVEKFKLSSGQRPKIIFKVLETAHMSGFLENNKPVYNQALVKAVDKLTQLLVKQYSVAVNLGKLPVNAVEKNWHEDLVKLEIKCLFEVVEFYNKILKGLPKEEIVRQEEDLNKIHKMAELAHHRIMRLTV
ncbi:hypothetical protein INT47_008645 [Mucor saturninus]|uniref:Uncharacterized protein n=1 Tax=Mucor saturninus TaxID=64648 RepID=A0A8H7QVW0_9FUNG|nr:hypothetical protein INT47_008645 [Mucor saturninus]